MKHIVVGTAGHIDHGKSALVLALTGTDPDRLKEEKERGITIDLGFASLQEGDAVHLGFVDVPGHERFVKNMLAGVGGIDLVMLVIAADESVMPQTREHFDICRLLHVQRGLVVVTKCDLADAELAELAAMEAKELVEESFLDGAPIVHVSAKTGEGLTELRRLLLDEAERMPSRSEKGELRLPVDRVFSMRGFGTVVTGTLISGAMKQGDELEALPGGRLARVRGIQVHGAKTDRAIAGQRTAVNLQGVELTEIIRGTTLAHPGRFVQTSMLDAELSVLASSPIAIKDLTRVHLHHNTQQVLARVRVLGGNKAIGPGERGFVQLRLEAPVVASVGDRFILRRYSPLETIAGGSVIDSEPVKHAISERSVVSALEALGAADELERLRVHVFQGELEPRNRDELRRRAGLSSSRAEELLARLEKTKEVIRLTQSGSNAVYWVGAKFAEQMRERLFDLVKQFQKRNPLQGGMPRSELRERLLGTSESPLFEWVVADLVTRRLLRAERELVATPNHKIMMSGEETETRQWLEARFDESGFSPPTLKELADDSNRDPKLLERVVRVMFKDGALVQLGDGVIVHSSALARLKELIKNYKDSDERIDVGRFKSLTGVTRKHAIPLLEWLDQQRVTRRTGNERIIL